MCIYNITSSISKLNFICINILLFAGWHSYSCCILYESKTFVEIHQKGFENRVGHTSMSFEGKETNDSKRTFSIHEFDCLRFNSGYAGRACGKFCFVFVAFKLEFAQKNKSIFESLPFKDIDEDVICITLVCHFNLIVCFQNGSLQLSWKIT